MNSINQSPYEANMSAMDEISGRIKQAIYPFSPGLIDVYIEWGIVFLRENIKVTSSTFVDDRFHINIEDDQLMMFYNEQERAAWVGEQAGLYFDSLRNESVPDTIELGYN